MIQTKLFSLFTIKLEDKTMNNTKSEFQHSSLIGASIQKGIITNQLNQSKEFYQKWLGMQIKFESDWFILLSLTQDSNFELALMLPNQEAVRKQYFQEAYTGKGVWLIIEVKDIRACYEEMKLLSAPIDLDLTEEEWGDIHFTLIDPNGIGIDFVQLRE
jgi:catechol 2,3-dioxygenase-like lactoylglutathione lyase family enzyme